MAWKVEGDEHEASALARAPEAAGHGFVWSSNCLGLTVSFEIFKAEDIMPSLS